MKDKLLLVGSGGLGRVVLEHAMKQYDCAFADDGYDVGQEICGVKVVGHIDDLDKLFGEFKQLVVSIGNNALREKIYKRAKAIGYTFPNIICDSVYISPFAKIGTGCIILNNVTIQNGVSLGDGAILNPGVELHHDSTVGDYVLIYTNSVVRTLTDVGDRVKIGSTCTISNYAKVPADKVIGDGETVGPV